MAGIYFKIEGAEIIQRDGETQSGDTVVWQEASTEKAAKNKALKILEREDINSVWIHKLKRDYDGDPLYQWSRYKDDKDWSGANFWGGI